MKGIEIFFFFLILAIAITGWVFFIVLYDYWKDPRLTPQDDRGWLRATIGLYVGIIFTVLLLLYTFIIGSREYHRKHVVAFQKKMNLGIQSPQNIMQYNQPFQQYNQQFNQPFQQYNQPQQAVQPSYFQFTQ